MKIQHFSLPSFALTALALIFVVSIYPPWVHVFSLPGTAQIVKPIGHYFIFSPPTGVNIEARGIEFDDELSGIEIATGRFLLYLTLCGSLSCFVGLISPILRRRKPIEHHNDDSRSLNSPLETAKSDSDRFDYPSEAKQPPAGRLSSELAFAAEESPASKHPDGRESNFGPKTEFGIFRVR